MRLDEDLHDADSPEREISLGTATILGIFLALALVCAAFFGFGYSLGRHSNAAVVPPASEAKADKPDSPFSGFKSSATPSRSADDTTADTSQADAPSATGNEKTTEQVAIPQDTPKQNTPKPHSVAFPVPPPPPATAPSPAAKPALPSVAANGQFLVQVSATSRQGDAEALIAALKSKGYTAAIRQVPQDKLFHVQIGPFATKKEADTVRQRLDTDGYKAIVK